MKSSTSNLLQDFVSRHPELKSCCKQVSLCVEALTACFRKGNKVLVCGNGGSAADSLHIVGELMKGFLLPRKLNDLRQSKIKALFPEKAQYLIDNLQEPLPAISLVNETALLTAYANDQAPDLCFAQQVLGYGNAGDILIAISTSGNSNNIIYAAQVAKVKGVKVISLTGKSGGKLKALTDILINVPSDETYVIQEFHLPVYHVICAAVEHEMFSPEED